MISPPDIQITGRGECAISLTSCNINPQEKLHRLTERATFHIRDEMWIIFIDQESGRSSQYF